MKLERSMTQNTGHAEQAKMPPQIPYIIANEGCERFSFYGMRNILTSFLITSLLLSMPENMRAGMAKEVFHTFVIGVYFFLCWVAGSLTVTSVNTIPCSGSVSCIAPDMRAWRYSRITAMVFIPACF
jgi:dipeptide/tripeptide permease